MGNSFVTGACPAQLGKTYDPTFEWKICGFSALLERGAISANSVPFQSFGYEWFLEVTPMLKEYGFGTPYVAICLVLKPTSLKPGYIVNAMFELSMYNHSYGSYCGFKDSYNFHVKKTHSKEKCFICLKKLLHSSDFLVDGCCIFGVEILKLDVCSPVKKPVVIQMKPTTVQNLSLQKKDFIKGTYTWTINNFLDLKLPVFSPAFQVGGHKWYISMDPLGAQYSSNSLSLYLHLDDANEVPLESGMMVEMAISILNQKNGKHYTDTGRTVFPVAGTTSWGWRNFIPLKKFKDPSRGYLVGSMCILKADITLTGSSSDG